MNSTTKARIISSTCFVVAASMITTVFFPVTVIEKAIAIGMALAWSSIGLGIITRKSWARYAAIILLTLVLFGLAIGAYGAIVVPFFSSKTIFPNFASFVILFVLIVLVALSLRALFDDDFKSEFSNST